MNIQKIQICHKTQHTQHLIMKNVKPDSLTTQTVGNNGQPQYTTKGILTRTIK